MLSNDKSIMCRNLILITYFIYFSQRTVQETKGWDVFREFPPKQDSGSMETQKCLDFTVRLCKVTAYLVVFVAVLSSGVVAKGTTLFMTSQLKKDRRIAYCNRNLGALNPTSVRIFRLKLNMRSLSNTKRLRRFAH